MNLTESQLRAINTDSREVICLAGAGAGKTRVVVKRIARLIQEGASIHDFLVLTFTRRAANEMRERLAKELDGFKERDLRKMALGTFHSIAYRILRADGERIGVRDNLTVAEQYGADEVLKSICEELGYLKGGRWNRTSWSEISKYRDDYYTGSRQKESRFCELAFSEYRNRLIEMNVLDYGSLLSTCRDLLTSNPDILAKYQQKWKYVFVDEMQDTDSVQYSIHNLFTQSDFFAVGDFRQCIYEWRGARPDLLLETHPNAEVIHLQHNFRSSHPIVHAANRVIQNNPEGDIPMIPSANLQPNEPVVIECSFEELAVKLREYSKNGFDWNDMAAIGRTHATLKSLADVLESKKIPHYRVGKSYELCDTDEFRRIHAGMKLNVNHRDNESFTVVRHWFCGPNEFPKIRTYAAKEDCSYLSAAHSLYPNKITEFLLHRGRPYQTGGDIIAMVDAAEGNNGTSYIQASQFWTRNRPNDTFQERWNGMRPETPRMI